MAQLQQLQSQPMHKKQLSIRRTLRESQLKEIKTNIRQHLILSYQQELELQHYNQFVEQLIRKGDLAGLADMFADEDATLMSSLDRSRIFQCYAYFRRNVDDLRSLHLLKRLIETHFTTIFASESLEDENKNFVDSIYQRVNETMKKPKREGMEQNGGYCQRVCEWLQILKQVYFRMCHSRAASSLNLLEINNLQNIEKFIFPWLPCLLKNKHYLTILSKISTHPEIFGSHRQQFDIFANNPQLFDTLISNICQCEDETWLHSFTILRHVLQMCTLNEQFVLTVISDYWFLVMSKLKADYNKKLNSLSHNLLFQGFTSFDRLLSVLSSNSTRILDSSFLFSSDYYQLLFQLLPHQTDKNRQTLYLIIQKSVEILEYNKQTLLDYIKVKSLRQIVQDLTNNMNHRLLVLVITIVYRLVRSTHMPCDTYQLLINYLFEEGIGYVLEILQFHKNRDVSVLAIDLLENEFREQNYEYEYEREEDKVLEPMGQRL